MTQEFEYKENLTIVVSLYAASSLSLLGSSFTIFTYLLFKNARNFGTTLILCLQIGDLCLSVGYSFFWMWLDHNEKYICDLQGALLMFGTNASVYVSFLYWYFIANFFLKKIMHFFIFLFFFILYFISFYFNLF